MSPWSHPRRHLGSLHQLAQLRVIKHQRRRDERTVRGVARPLRKSRATDDGMSHERVHAVRADDQVRSQDFARREREGRALRIDGRYARPELHADVGRRDGTVEEGVVEVCAVEVIVARAVPLDHRLGIPARIPHHAPVAVPPQHGRLGLHADGVEGVFEAPADEELGHVGRDLDARAGAHLAEGGGGGGIEDSDVVP